jgi:hypothetical protein
MKIGHIPYSLARPFLTKIESPAQLVSNTSLLLFSALQKVTDVLTAHD